jgi:hypothetical protein
LALAAVAALYASLLINGDRFVVLFLIDAVLAHVKTRAALNAVLIIDHRIPVL